ncbi:unnamed protein product [Mesocestoides corti]|uniref:Ig-like domain-containing protein n=1 Tax=Mesocestoides corti TaxID=53468 RepID=A0A0R3U123_MESCO|nr:unnamed protein product [Mesocestoides corti]
MKITANERISIVPQSSESVFQLRFDPVIKDDGGEYRCVYNHETGVKYKVVVVNIQVRPKVNIDPQGEVELLEGQSAFLVCNASGTPYPQIRWWMLPLATYQRRYSLRRRGTYEESHVTLTFPTTPVYHQFHPRYQSPPLVQSTQHLLLIPLHDIAAKYKQSIFVRRGRLIISSVNRDLVGWYFCEAYNSVRPSAMAHSLLTVHYPPRVFLPQREVFFAPFGNVSLVCEFQAFPLAEVEWALDGRNLNAVPCDSPQYRPSTWCTEKTIDEVIYQNGDETNYGFDDSLSLPDLHNSKVEEVSSRSLERHRTFNLTQSLHDLTLYGRRVKAVLHVWVTEAGHFGRYSCRMRTRHGLAEGFIRLRNKGNSLSFLSTHSRLI